MSAAFDFRVIIEYRLFAFVLVAAALDSSAGAAPCGVTFSELDVWRFQKCWNGSWMSKVASTAATSDTQNICGAGGDQTG